MPALSSTRPEEEPRAGEDAQTTCTVELGQGIGRREGSKNSLKLLRINPNHSQNSSTNLSFVFPFESRSLLLVDYPYVPLTRRFIDISGRDPEDESDAAMLLIRKGEKAGAFWKELEELDCAVILGSAGSGKTREVLEQAKAMRLLGHSAFVLRLEALCRNPVEASFSPQDGNASVSFTDWKNKGGCAFAFLDALDEARLPDARNSSALADALAQLSASVGKAGKSLKIVMTTRPTEWQGESDKATIQSALKGLRASPNAGTEQSEPKVKVFRLGSLDTDDITALAVSRHVEPEPFLAAIDKAKVANLATQPLDVHLLLDAWSEEISSGREPASAFTSRRRIYEDIAHSRLRVEHGQERRSNLDRFQARYACEKLAAAAVLSDVRDFTSETGLQGAILAELALATDIDKWSERDVRQLLSYGIFHPSISGRVRFAHKEIQDYLAACYFDRAISKNAGSTEVVSPLLAKGLGPNEIPQSTEHVLGWLSTLNPIGRKLVTQLRPALLIETGDPTALTAEEKSRALASQVSLYEDRKYRGEWFYQTDVQTFATPDLAPAIEEQLAVAKSPEVRELLVEMARFGKMTELGQGLAEIACNNEEALRVRTEACLALAELNLTSFANEVLSAALSAPSPEHEDTDSAPSWNMFQSAALSYVYPAGVPIIDAIALVARLRREARNYSSIAPHYLDEFASKIPADECIHWLQIFLRFAAGPRSQQNEWMPTTKSRFTGLTSAICSLLIRALETAPDICPRELIFDAAEYLFQRDQIHDFSGRNRHYEELAERLRPLTDIKAQMIQRRIDRFAQARSAHMIAYHAVDPLQFKNDDRNVSIFAVEDVEAFCSRLKLATDKEAKEIAADSARQISEKLTDPEERGRAGKLISTSIRKYGTKELRAPYSIFAPFMRIYYRFRHVHYYKIRRRVNVFRDRVSGTFRRAKNAVQFVQESRAISEGNAVHRLVWAVRKHSNELGHETVAELRKDYGKWVAGKFSQGFRNYWRKNTIAYAERNTYGANVGLTGLALEQDGDMAGLSNIELGNAFRFAFCNLNNFPDWFYEFAEKKGDIFKSVAISMVEASLQEENDREFSSDAFSRIAYSNDKIRELLANEIFQKLQVWGAPSNRHDLDIALNIIARSPSVDASAATDYLVQGFEAAAVSFSFSEAWSWLDALFIVNANAAWGAWLAMFGTSWSTSNKALFVRFMGRERRSFSRAEELEAERNDLAENPEVLEHMTRASYLIWPPSRDPRHEDVYSPDIEDKATDRRGWYLNTLTGLGTKEALDALERLVSDPLLIDHRDTFLFQRDKMVRSSARRPTLSIQESIAYLNTLTKSPTTVDEFRAMVKRHINALLEQLHHSDDDESYLFRRDGATEDDLRNWLSGRMREIGKEHYEVIREQEVATENRPDLRIHARKVELGLISVEIKLADKGWTGDVLVDKVKSQLADQYMHENGSHTGFYLLANAAKPKKKKVDKKTKEVLRKAFSKKVSGRFVDFVGLIEAVEAKAAIVTTGLGGGKVVDVISVDLSEK